MKRLLTSMLLIANVIICAEFIYAQPADSFIQPGKGWKTLTIGAARAAIEAEYGKPEVTTPGKEPGSGFATYTAKGFVITYGPGATVTRLNFIGDAKLYSSASIKFGSFAGQPAKCVTWGTTEAKVSAAYGKPANRSSFVQSTTGLEIVELSYPGADLVFKGDKLFQIKINPIANAAATPSPIAPTTPTAAAQPTAIKRTKDGRPLFDAVVKGDEAAVQRLIAEGSILDFAVGADTTLAEAIRYRKPKIAKILLEAGADPNFADPKYNGTPVMMAAQMNDDETMALLVNTYKANVNLVSISKRTALHTAADFRNANGTAIMLKAGANPNVLDDQGRSPLDIAKANDGSYVLKHLEPATNAETIAKLKAGFKPNTAATAKPVATNTPTDDDEFYEDGISGSISSSLIGLARREGFKLLDQGEMTLQGRNSNSESGAEKKFISRGSIYQFVVISKDAQTINAIMNGTLLTIPCDECRTSISKYWTSLATTKKNGYTIISLQFSLLDFQDNIIYFIPKGQNGGGKAKWLYFSKPGK